MGTTVPSEEKGKKDVITILIIISRQVLCFSPLFGHYENIRERYALVFFCPVRVLMSRNRGGLTKLDNFFPKTAQTLANDIIRGEVVH